MSTPLSPYSITIVYLLLLTFPASSICGVPYGSQQTVATITFSVSGINVEDVPPDAAILVVDNASYSFSDLPKSFNWTTGSFHVFEWVEVIPSIVEGKRYVWSSTSGISLGRTGFIIVPADGGFISAEYKVQYLWVISADGLGSDAVGVVAIVDGWRLGFEMLPASFWWDEGSLHVCCYEGFVYSTVDDVRYANANHDRECVNLTVLSPGVLIESYHIEYRLHIGGEAGKGTTDPPPGSYWFDDGAYVNITAIPDKGYAFKMWTAIFAVGSTYGKFDNPTTVWIRGPISLVANFTQAFDFTVSIDPSTLYVYKGSSVTASIFVESVGEPPLRITLFVSGVPQGVSYSLDVESDFPPIWTTLTITATPAAQAGTYVLTIVAVSENMTKVREFSLIILEKAWYEQLWILLVTIVIAVVVATIFMFTKLRQRLKTRLSPL